MPKSKYKRCEECGLKVRGDDIRHKYGYHHLTRAARLKKEARK